MITITIHPFVAGIIATIISEVIAFLVYALVLSVKEKRRTRQNKSN